MATFYRFHSPQENTESKAESVAREVKEGLSKVLDDSTLKTKRIIEVEVTPPTICKSPKELSKAQKLSLRTSIQTFEGDKVELKQFDPNFFSRGNIWCRYPGCKQRRLRQYKFDGTKQKEDLYLCPSHRKNVEDYVAKICAQKGIHISTENLHPEDFKGYTTMIGVLESGLLTLTKKSPWGKGAKEHALVYEAFLNMRNYLFIVNALLNPDDKNLNTALNPHLAAFKVIVEALKDDKLKKNLPEHVKTLRQLIDCILYPFGVTYKWAHYSLAGNPGAQIGAGIGGVFGGCVGFIGGPAAGALAAAGGAAFGGLIGSGLYKLKAGITQSDEESSRLRGYQQFAQATKLQGDGEQQQRGQSQQPTEDERSVYCVEGNDGDLDLKVVAGCQ